MRTLTVANTLTDPHFPFLVRKEDPQNPNRLHSHEFVELVVVSSGSGVHYTKDQEYIIRAGDVFVLHKGHAHGYRETQDLCIYNVLYEPQVMLVEHHGIGLLPGYQALFSLEPRYRKEHRFESRLRLSDSDLVNVVGLLDRIIHELGRRERGFQFVATALFMQLVATLSRLYSRSDSRAAHELLDLENLIAYLETRLDEPLRLEDLAARSHISVSTLLRRFKKATGLTPIDFLVRLRLEKARRMLRETRMPITEISYQTGFSDSNYFARQFRKNIGMSPGEYRRRSA